MVSFQFEDEPSHLFFITFPRGFLIDWFKPHTNLNIQDAFASVSTLVKSLTSRCTTWHFFLRCFHPTNCCLVNLGCSFCSTLTHTFEKRVTAWLGVQTVVKRQINFLLPFPTNTNVQGTFQHYNKPPQDWTQQTHQTNKDPSSEQTWNNPQLDTSSKFTASHPSSTLTKITEYL